MAEFEMPMEEQIRSLAKRFGGFETKLDSIDSRLDSMDSRLDSMDSRLGSMDSKLDSISIRLEDTNRIAKLGLEGLEALRETTDMRFSEVRREQVEQTDLLKSVLVHIGKRVERVESVVLPKRRRRS